MKNLLYWAFVAALPLLSRGQTDTTKATEEVNFEEFGDADNKVVKTFCTQKVSYLSPTKLISVGYETQLPFDFSSVGTHGLPAVIGTAQTRVSSFGGLRLGVNTPVVSRSNFILNLGLTYWNTRAVLTNPERSSNMFGNAQALNSAGINATAFKPFDNKHFLIVQASGDLNGNYRTLGEMSTKGITYSATVVYGWKKNDNFMWGLGITRTYRAGQLLHIPVVLYNRTFNQKWGVEAIFPAKVNVRRNFSPTSYVMLGYEIEGNAYYLGNSTGTELHLRRGELKPRITFEKQLSGFVWVSAQAGLRYNWRFNAFNTQNPTKDQRPLFENTLGNPLYFNVSINLVSP